MTTKDSEYRRMAGRTKEKFKEDIRKGHLIEKEVVERYSVFYKSNTGKDLKIVDNGVDNSGKYLNINDVRDDADFVLNGVPVEIKVIKNDLFQFRLKLNLIKSYIKQGACILIVLGWETDTPKFTLLNQHELKHMATFGKKEVSGDWEGKPTVLVYRNSFEWKPLPKINS